MVGSRVPWGIVSMGFLVVLMNSALLVPGDAVSTGALDQLHAAAKGACSGQTACPGACVPNTCVPSVGLGCVPSPAGTAGCTLQFSTIGQCSGILASNCVVTTPCGADINPTACPAFVNGMCPPSTCVTATVGSSGC
jgi:hypothetical protein